MVRLVLMLTTMSLISACMTEHTPPTASTPETNSYTDNKTPDTEQVVNIVDGITIDVVLGDQVTRIRYLGIEIPDYETPTDTQTTSIRERALEFNRFLVENKTVELEKDSVETDSSGHLLRYVYVDGEMINITLLANGYATVSDFPAKFKQKMSFSLAEQDAEVKHPVHRDKHSEEKPDMHPAPSSITTPFKGGTLPLPPELTTSCEYSNTNERVIKGNTNLQTNERIYHIPNGIFYSTTEISREDGDRWFCTEKEAIAAGWTKSKH